MEMKGLYDMCRCETSSLLSASVKPCRVEMIRGKSARPGKLPKPSAVGAENKLYSWKLSREREVQRVSH